MAIYKRNYAGYSGRLTARWTRFLVLTRYSYARLFQSRFLVLFIALCLSYPLGCAAYIYVAHNISLLALMNVGPANMPKIDGGFFYWFCTIQGVEAYLLTALVGPSLVSPDLVNGAMPLYLCRPFSRTEYVLGKMSVLVFLLSLITWVPGLVLYSIHASLAGWEWLTANFWLAGAIFVGLMIWIVILSLIALALSAWIKWKIAAGALVLGVFFAGAGFGAAINSVMRTSYGALINIKQVMQTVWAELFRYDSGTDMALGDAWITLGVVCLICLWLLSRRIRAFEVVR